jgi:hypothetical protein
MGPDSAEVGLGTAVGDLAVVAALDLAVEGPGVVVVVVAVVLGLVAALDFDAEVGIVADVEGDLAVEIEAEDLAAEIEADPAADTEVEGLVADSVEEGLVADFVEEDLAGTETEGLAEIGTEAPVVDV